MKKILKAEKSNHV